MTSLKNVAPRTKDNNILKDRVLKNAENLFNDLYYIYQDKYHEEKNNLNTKDSRYFDYKKLRHTDDYLYPSEEEQQQASKKQTQTDVNEFTELIIKKETDINKELFKNYLGFQLLNVMLKKVYTI